MRILSVNCNKFGGMAPNGKGALLFPDVVDRIVLLTKFTLELEEDSLVVLHEVNSRDNGLEDFADRFDPGTYTVHLPTYLKESGLHPYGCTLAVTRKEAGWTQLPSLAPPGSFDYANKSVVLRGGGCTVMGVHMPYDTGYWDLLIDAFRRNCSAPLVIIGDLNTCDEGTPRREKYRELLSCGAVDAWTARDGDPDRATYENGKRLDYALLSPGAYRRLRTVRVIDCLRTGGITDHSGLYVELASEPVEAPSG